MQQAVTARPEEIEAIDVAILGGGKAAPTQDRQAARRSLLAAVAAPSAASKLRRPRLTLLAPRAIEETADPHTTKMITAQPVSTPRTEPTEADADSLQVYLREISAGQLLTGEQELRLSREMEVGLGAEEMLDRAGPGADPTGDLASLVRLGERARERLITSNLRLVVAVARHHINSGAELTDLIQEGNMGLMRAVDRFDWRKGNRFSTYALWWIRQAVTTAVIDASRSVRLPTHVVDTLGRMSKAEQRLTQELGRHPNDGEISDELGVTSTKLADLKKIRERPSSLEAPMGDEGECSLSDLVEDHTVVTPLGAALGNSLHEEMLEAMSSLTIREQQVLWLRFGLDDDQSRTLEEVGRVLHITKERVRQVEGRAIRKLRQAPRARWLAEFAE